MLSTNQPIYLPSASRQPFYGDGIYYRHPRLLWLCLKLPLSGRREGGGGTIGWGKGVVVDWQRCELFGNFYYAWLFFPNKIVIIIITYIANS